MPPLGLAGYSVKRILASALILAVFFGVTLLLYRRRRFDKTQRNAALVLSVYIVVLLYNTVIGRPAYAQYTYQIYLFQSYKWLFTYNGGQFFRQMVVNLVMLMPVGFLLPMVFGGKRKYRLTLLLSLLLTVFVETAQMLLKCGTFEVDDIINNVIGAVLGMALYAVIHRVRQHYIMTEGNQNERN